VADEPLSILIAGIAAELDLSRLPPETRAGIVSTYAPFAGTNAAVPIHVCVEFAPGAPFIEPEQHREWQIRTRERAGQVQYTSFYERGWIDLSAGIAYVLLRRAGNLENFLRVLYARECLARGGLLLHASGVIRNGRGYVFFGPSGAGKTTVTRLSRDETVLSDDLVIVAPHHGCCWVYGVPFRGTMSEAPRTNAAAPLCGLFALDKAPTHRVVELAPVYAVAQLAACVPFVMGQAAAAAQVVAICTALAAKVPVRTLHFRPDAGFWNLLD